MNRRTHTSPTLSPSLTGGGDRPAAACLGHWDAFDMLIDYGANRTTQYALEDAASLCNSCPLQTSCWSENWDEPWMLAMRGVPFDRHNNPKAADDAA